MKRLLVLMLMVFTVACSGVDARRSAVTTMAVSWPIIEEWLAEENIDPVVRAAASEVAAALISGDVTRVMDSPWGVVRDFAMDHIDSHPEWSPGVKASMRVLVKEFDLAFGSLGAPV